MPPSLAHNSVTAASFHDETSLDIPKRFRWSHHFFFLIVADTRKVNEAVALPKKGPSNTMHSRFVYYAAKYRHTICKNWLFSSGFTPISPAMLVPFAAFAVTGLGRNTVKVWCWICSLQRKSRSTQHIFYKCTCSMQSKATSQPLSCHFLLLVARLQAECNHVQ